MLDKENMHYDKDMVIAGFTISKENIFNIQQSVCAKYPKTLGLTFETHLHNVLEDYIKSLVIEWVEKFAREQAEAQVSSTVEAAKQMLNTKRIFV
jgi:hypothetical protein